MANTCTVTKVKTGRWQVKCSKCSFRVFRGSWHLAASVAWRHSCKK